MHLSGRDFNYEPFIAPYLYSEVDFKKGRTSIPDSVDVFGKDLPDYYDEMRRTTFTTSQETAMSRQQRVSAAAQGIYATDTMSDLSSLSTRIDFVNRLSKRLRERVARVKALSAAAANATSHEAAGSEGQQSAGNASQPQPGPGSSVLPIASVAAYTTWGGDVWGLRRELIPWIQYHTAVGISRYQRTAYLM